MKWRDQEVSNSSFAPTFAEIVDARRRRFLSLGGAGLVMNFLPWSVAAAARAGRAAHPLASFASIPASFEDKVIVPAGFVIDIVHAWGDPVSDGPAFRADASNTAEEQAQQVGMHHDGMHFFPLDGRSDHGLLVVNHEYTDDGLLHADGMKTWSAEKVAKSMAAHGVSIVEIRLQDGRWQVVRPSRYARRITAATPIAISGPAAGAEAMRTAADASGRLVLGTLNNCAMGVTPWGTYLTCEENFNGYFKASRTPTPLEKRYGVSEKTAGYRWHEFEERFDAEKHPHEANRFGWVVEIDPFRPESRPVKRTALGRFKHEGAFVTLAKDRRIVVYMGDDERFEYIYKYVSKKPWRGGPGGDLLDEGTLYVARFHEDGSGEWLPLVYGQRPLTAENGFVDQADVLIRTRMAADAVRATRMDRPEWIAVHPQSGEVYCSLTNNARRGTPESPGLNGANPRPENLYGHIIRWREQGGDAASLRFAWDIFILCGDPAQEAPHRKGDIRGDLFASPDGLWFDPQGRLWIQTDVSTSALGNAEHAAFGNNQMLVADPTTKEVRRFLVGPRGCEVTGITATPDGKTLFVNIQHPGETPSERSDPERPLAVSSWPANQFPHLPGGRPRSATLAIRRADGKPVLAA
ncbi:MAG: PhoX family phosphatase [Rhodocyclaceae bacterium]|nr:PhoX family phosphatase [Rhodocyclaceae bacterium]